MFSFVLPQTQYKIQHFKLNEITSTFQANFSATITAASERTAFELNCEYSLQRSTRKKKELEAEASTSAFVRENEEAGSSGVQRRSTRKRPNADNTPAEVNICFFLENNF